MKNFLINLLLLGLLNILSLLNKDNIFVGVGIFSLLTYLPGTLLFSLTKIKEKTFFQKLSISVGLGTLLLMALGLISNQIYPLLGINNPLAQMPFLWVYNSAIVILALISSFVEKRKNISFKFTSISWESVAYISSSLLLPIGAVLGAVSLNNGGSNSFSMATYIMIAIYSVIVLLFHKNLSSNKISFSLFIVSLTLLLINSLRGWYITGHDVQQEFMVFQLTKQHDFWNINLFKDPYNACLSLTILPTIYANITKINDYFIYKTLYQIIFSFTVVNIFYILSRYFRQSLAYIASLNFLFFPTFLTDMPMLNRQELAFFYVSLMLYILFDKKITGAKKTLLFSAMSMGMIFSHYSTSYLTIGLFTLAYISTFLISWIRKIFAPEKKSFIERYSSLSWSKNINILMVLFLLSFAFFWNSIYTKTSDHIERTLTTLANNIVHPLKEKEKSGESLYSIINFKPVSQETLLNRYITYKLGETRKEASSEELYDKKVYSKYPLQVAEMDVLKPSISFVQNYINADQMFSIVSGLRQSYAKIVQILILIGMTTLLFYKKFRHEVHVEYYLLGVISILVILMQLVVPQNSVDYGILRLFQQSLMFFSIFIVLGFYWLLDILKVLSEKIKITVLMLFTLFYFMLLSGVIPQLTGGYYPQLPLNNSGTYYNMYYSAKSDITTLKWIGKHVDKGIPLQTDSFDSANIKTYASIAPITGTLPGAMRKDAYVYLNSFNTSRNAVYLYYNGSLLSYTNPVAFLKDNKNLIYNNGGGEVYK